MSGHHDDDVHFFPDANIEEGNGKVPKWYLVLVGILSFAFVYYLATYMIGEQPSSAQMKRDEATAAQPADDDAGEDGGETDDGEAEGN